MKYIPSITYKKFSNNCRTKSINVLVDTGFLRRKFKWKKRKPITFEQNSLIRD